MHGNLLAVELVHRLLFRALIEVRSQGHEHKNKVVFYLADLFHDVVLDMECAAEGKQSYEAVLAALAERAKELGLSRWLEMNEQSLVEERSH